MKRYFLPILFLAAFYSCSVKKQAASYNARTIAPATTPIAVNGKVMANIWMQRSAEYKALCFQAYNLAHLRLDQSLAQTSAKPKAIVTDIDETVLDNSPHDMSEALEGKDFDLKTWKEWTAKAAADTLAGAASFLKYAASKGVEVFYITNREESERAGTLKNLQKFNLPNADNEHLLLKQATSSKETRRNQVLQTHEIVMLLGDNLADFSALFEHKNYEDRLQNTQRQAAEFGKKFIVLPNPAYGDWESVLYQYKYQLKAAQKDSVLKKWAIKEAY
ncbi:5'-nucleotidase, lipoprotein e(P4) family [Mucilaginibacter arboris]|uniref:5'-nucleotidase, lipoprotein e(P4) family n=1 Tax=Mucilaginibacter arboris TaxID=2682090 RepID=A0A7K1SZS2_9SPHI|nr:5'-nucleotidase, lipoprotein e(P4) family [Mucilaginibacter arboris]MVN22811.1 5'-nucleotidase, lipoprotein e(P4) family [Mucilaginibacter arboris]